MNDKRACIVCKHVAIENYPILYASRNAQTTEEDSGWQFLCAKHNEDETTAQVWTIQEILTVEPSLTPYINLNEGFKLWRNDERDSWQKM